MSSQRSRTLPDKSPQRPLPIQRNGRAQKPVKVYAAVPPRDRAFGLGIRLGRPYNFHSTALAANTLENLREVPSV